MVDVSIVIVCMNNLKNLYPCLEGIRKYTNKVTYETFVVAYLFTRDNLEKAKKDFPWVNYIESNEIRGFSENNNLALKQAKGEYCFVVNDDTEMRMPVIDRLFDSIEELPPNVAVISPVSYFADGKMQSCGRPPHTIKTYVLSSLKVYNEQKTPSRYTYQPGVFQTYDLWGAFFLIKTSVFKEMGWFDERYFFSPEDIALSRKLNRRGYSCYVNSDVSIIHYEGMTGKGTSKLQVATKPASFIGNLIYYSEDSPSRYVLVSILFFFLCIPTYIYHFFLSKFGIDKERNTILVKSVHNCMRVCFTSLTPKQAFLKYSQELLNI